VSIGGNISETSAWPEAIVVNPELGRGLLAEAEDAGLKVRAEGDRLVVRGPRSAEALMRRLIDRKPDVLAALSSPFRLRVVGTTAAPPTAAASAPEPPPPPPAPGPADGWDDARAVQVVAAVHARIDRALQVGGEADTDARRRNAAIDKKLAEDFCRNRDPILWNFLASVEGVLARWRRSPGGTHAGA
jgi:hypothetical protein